jgi:hypothetical protein
MRNRLRNSLVVVEIALSLVLLVGASLFVRSFLNLQDAKAGIETSQLMTLRFYMPGDQYEPPDAMVRRVDDIVRRVEALPASSRRSRRTWCRSRTAGPKAARPRGRGHRCRSRADLVVLRRHTACDEDAQRAAGRGP